MKLTDWAILFAAVFICFALPPDLLGAYQSQAFFYQKEYGRILDRACEDSLMDSVLLEQDDGRVVVDTDRVYARFAELLDLGFDAVSQEQRDKMRESVRMKRFYHLDPALSVEQTDEIRRQMELAVTGYDGKRAGVQADAEMFSFYFPYIPKEDWYQKIAGPSLYALFEPDSSGDPFMACRRYTFSGARIVKQIPEG